MISKRSILELTKQLNKLQAAYKKMPEQNLRIHKNGRYTKWYIEDGEETRYLSKAHRSEAKQLAQKCMLGFEIEELKHQRRLKIISLNHEKNIMTKRRQQYYNNSDFISLVGEKFAPLNAKLRNWQNEDYPRSDAYPEHLNIKTFKGDLVRSKSEESIANALYLKRIPYRYENIIFLEDIEFAPDFTIRHPETGEIIYWEHFGRMDDPEYAQKTFHKLQVYSRNGLILGKNFIATFETKDNPLTDEMVEKMIQLYFG